MLVLLVLDWHYTLELCKDLTKWFVNNICKNIQSSSMRHTDNNFFSSEFHETIHAAFHTWNERLTTFKTKSLHGIEFLLQKVGKAICPKKSIEDMYFGLIRKWLELSELKFVPDPVALLPVLNVHVLNTNVSTIGLSEGVIDFT